MTTLTTWAIDAFWYTVLCIFVGFFAGVIVGYSNGDKR